jgi:hypothetical protein
MNVVKGAIGLAKCGLGVNRTNETTRLARIETCRVCPHVYNPSGKLTTFSVCGGGCGCLIVCKTAIASETCPLNRW